MKFNYSLISIFAILLTTSWACGGAPEGSNEQLDAEVDDFSTAYFNYDFVKAMKHCTPESKQWLVYAASNIHEADLEVLRKAPEGASVDINDYEFSDDDTTGFALVTIHNYMKLDTIGKAGRMIGKADFKLPIVLRNNKWTIKMEGLPRNERRSHD